MEISENGPQCFKVDSLLETAMNSYWKALSIKGKWHFVRTPTSVLNYGERKGKTVSNLLKKQSKFPFMDD